jgi:hypothetical protein
MTVLACRSEGGGVVVPCLPGVVDFGGDDGAAGVSELAGVVVPVEYLGGQFLPAGW